MTKDIPEGKWKQVRSKIHARWNRLTEDDIDKIDGNRDQFIDVLQERYGVAKEKAENQLNRYLKAVTIRSKPSFIYDHGWDVGPSQRHNRRA